MPQLAQPSTIRTFGLVLIATVLARSAASQASLVRGDAETGIVEVTVLRRDGSTVADARARLSTPSGVRLESRTGLDGKATFPQVPIGAVELDVIAIGLMPGRVTFTIASGLNTAPIQLNEAVAPVLNAVRVEGDRVVRSVHSEFEARRLLHQTTLTVTADDIAKRNPVDTWQMLTAVPSVRVIQGAAGVTLQSSRGDNFVRGKLMPCYVQVLVDGILLNRGNGPANLSELPAPGEIHGIELFAGSAAIPPNLGVNGSDRKCGLLTVWTK